MAIVVTAASVGVQVGRHLLSRRQTGIRGGGETWPSQQPQQAPCLGEDPSSPGLSNCTITTGLWSQWARDCQQGLRCQHAMRCVQSAPGNMHQILGESWEYASGVHRVWCASLWTWCLQ